MNVGSECTEVLFLPVCIVVDSVRKVKLSLLLQSTCLQEHEACLSLFFSGQFHSQDCSLFLLVKAIFQLGKAPRVVSL